MSRKKGPSRRIRFVVPSGLMPADFKTPHNTRPETGDKLQLEESLRGMRFSTCVVRCVRTPVSILWLGSPPVKFAWSSPFSHCHHLRRSFSTRRKYSIGAFWKARRCSAYRRIEGIRIWFLHCARCFRFVKLMLIVHGDVERMGSWFMFRHLRLSYGWCVIK